LGDIQSKEESVLTFDNWWHSWRAGPHTTSEDIAKAAWNAVTADIAAKAKEREEQIRMNTLREVFTKWDQEGVEGGDIWNWLCDELGNK
jgi:hypothetical protein